MATTLNSIRQGEAIALSLAFVDKTGVAINVDTVDTTNVLVTLSNKGVNFAKYSLTGGMGSDWGTLTVAGNIITILVTREQSKLWESGYVLATITAEFVDVELGFKVIESEIRDLLQVYPSLNKPYTLIHA